MRRWIHTSSRTLLLTLLLLLHPLVAGSSGFGAPDRAAQTEEEDGDDAEGDGELRLLVAIRKGRGGAVQAPAATRVGLRRLPPARAAGLSLVPRAHIPRPPRPQRLLIL